MDLDILRKEVFEELATASSVPDLEAVKIKYLGRKQGVLTMLLKSLKDMNDEDKRKFGPESQRLRADIEAAIGEKEKVFGEAELKAVDLSIPPKKESSGRIHIMSRVYNDVVDIFHSMNFSVAEGPELEEEKYNFDALNIPADHPAREMWDTFWVKSDKQKGGRVLRTHTSPVQIRYMLSHKPPFQMISPGRVFRYEATDATHETNFHQIEGLVLGKDISLANFKFIIEEFFRQFFAGKKIEVRLRASYFPFVEPGVEVDVRIDSSRWLEIAGAGMVHPKVLEEGGVDPKKWQGFAFGFGMERLAIIKYGIPDIRLFMSGDTRFIKQF